MSAPTRAGGLRRRLAPYLLSLPAALLILGLVAAFLSLVTESLRPAPDAAGFTLAQYERLAGTPLYRGYFWRSLGLATVATALTLLLGYPVALYANRCSAGTRRALFAFLTLTFFSDYVLRMFGLILVLGRGGLVNRLALQLGLVDEPIRLMFNALGVMIGLVSASLPLAILIIAGVIGRIDPSTVAAARLLGASPAQAFASVVLPLSMPGVVSAGVIVFLLSLNSFITPALLGGGFLEMVATFVYEQAINLADLPLGAAASFALFLVSLAILFGVNGAFEHFGRRFGVRGG